MRYNLTKVPDNLCASIDLTPFATLFEELPEPPKPTRHLAASAGEATCHVVRLHGKVRATFNTGIRVAPSQGAAAADYRVLVGDDAALNDRPEPLPGLGEEAVIFEMTGSTRPRPSR